ncbi:MAG: SMC family ATPase [Candidatus Micrarchaeia archaeon]|jgi:exonuclease SbcC
MIRKIALTNWRSHEKTELGFGTGTNIIVGIMGAGKSSVLEGICYGLFGTFPALQARKLKASDIISSRPEQKSQASVELEFDAEDGETYTVLRTIAKGKGGGSAELRKDGKLIESAPERVTEYVEKLLRIDYDLFTRAIFAEQNRIDYFLTLRPGERKEKIDELLGIDKFENARSNLRSVVNRFKSEGEALKSATAGFKPEKMKAELGELEKEQQELRHKLGEGEKKMKSAESERRECDAASKKAEERRQKWLAHDKDKARHEQTLAELKREIERGEKELKGGLERGGAPSKDAEKEASALRLELAGIEKELAHSEKLRTDASMHLGTVRAKAEDLAKVQKKNDELQKKLASLTSGKTADALKADHSSSRNALEKLRTALAEAEASITSIEDSEKSLAKAGAACPVCEAPLDEGKKRSLMEKRRHEVVKARDTAVSLKSDLSSKSKTLAELEERIARALELQAGISKLDDAEFKRLHAEAERLGAELEKQKKVEDSLKEARAASDKKSRLLEQSMRTVHELSERRERLKLAEKELEKLSAEVSSLAFKEEEVHKAQASLRECEKEMSALNANLGNWTVQLSKCNQQLADLRSRLEEAEKSSKLVSQWGAKVQELEIFNNAIVDVQASLRTELIDAINSAMNSVWRTLYPYGDYSQIRLSAGEAGYELELGDGERWLVAEGAASGGERACACLALRIAFARVLVPNLSWLILDEPTHNLDAEAVRTLALALRDDIPSIVKQVFVITHEEGLKEAASGRLYLLDRDKKGNAATSAELLSS